MKIQLKIVDITDDDRLLMVPRGCGRSVWFTYYRKIFGCYTSDGTTEFYKKTRPNSKLPPYFVMDYQPYRRYNFIFKKIR